MKKIGIIVALALIVTIAGTYATWNYTTKATGVDPKTATATVGLTSYIEQVVNGGTITVELGNLHIYVDDDGKHNAKLVFSSKEITEDDPNPDNDGYIIVKFTPDADDETTKGLVLKCETTTVPENTYDGKTIFAAGEIVNSEREIGSAAEGEQYAQWKIQGDDLAKLFKVNEGITADSIIKYQALEEALKNAQFVITVSAASTSST